MRSKEAQAAFDIGTASRTRSATPTAATPFGQRALLARRLVEAGVPFVTLYDGGWDHHTKLFDALKKRLPTFETDRRRADRRPGPARACSTRTLVIALGEFGRTPQINKDAGRDHWSNAMSRAVRRRRHARRPGRRRDRQARASPPSSACSRRRTSPRRSTPSSASTRARSSTRPNGRPDPPRQRPDADPGADGMTAAGEPIEHDR